MKRSELKRKTPMRSGRAARPAAPTPETEEQRADRKQGQALSAMKSVVPRAARMASTPAAPPVVKFDYVRSPALLKACREIACQNCGADNGTVVAAHSNQLRHGKAKGLKASDQYVASLCYRCHCALDQGSKMTGPERTAMWDQAHARTVRELVRVGLWPDDCPIPDIRRMN